MPTTDHFEFASPDVRSQFDALFGFATGEGIIETADRDHYARRFLVDAHATRRDLDLLVAGKRGIDLSGVRGLPGYPRPSEGGPSEYPAASIRARRGVPASAL